MYILYICYIATLSFFPNWIFNFLKSRDENFEPDDIYDFMKKYHLAGILMNKDTYELLKIKF
jgi:hypothetical protein